MSTLDIAPGLQSTPTNIVEVISFEEWHPEVTDEILDRLSRGTRWNSFRTYGIDAKSYLDANGDNSVSYREVLDFFLYKYSVAFAIEHYVTEQSLRPRILEVGSWPMNDTLVSPQFGTTLIAILSQNENYAVAGVDSIDVETAFPYKAWTPPYTGDANLFYANIHDEETRSAISQYLEGLPQIIVGNLVFEKGLGEWQPSELKRKLTKRTGIVFNGEDYVERTTVSEDLAKTCNSYLAPEGVLVVCNNRSGEIPDFVESMPLLRVYEDEHKGELVQIRAKV